jgi:hypothetical protein
MIGIILGVILVGVGGFFVKIRKNKKIGSLCLIPGAIFLGISMIVLGLGGSNSNSSKTASSSNRPSNSGVESAANTGTASASSAKTSKSDSDFTVSLTDDGNGAIITGYTGKATTVRIPKTIQGMPVREIGPSILSSGRGGVVNNTVTDVIIPEGVNIIRSSAFSYSFKLTSVTIPESVIEIHKMAFYNSPYLKSITLPKNLKLLGYGAFSSTNIDTITLPKGVEIIEGKDHNDPGVFEKCKNLKTVIIPEGFSVIHTNMFGACTSLNKINLPASISKIGMWAFGGCSELSSVTIPDTVTTISIHDRAFEGCPKLNLTTQALLKRLGYTGKF